MTWADLLWWWGQRPGRTPRRPSLAVRNFPLPPEPHRQIGTNKPERDEMPDTGQRRKTGEH